MTRKSLAFNINVGYFSQILVLLVLGSVAVIGVNQLSASLQELSDSSTSAQSDISRTIENFDGVRQAMKSLEESQAGFEKISQMQETLAESSQATAEIGKGLGLMKQSADQQMETLGSISSGTQLIAKDIESSLHLVQQGTRAAEEINRRVLSSYISFYDYLNEYTTNVDSALEDIAAISTKLGEIGDLIPEAGGSEAVHEAIGAVSKNLRRYRYYMAELGETTSVTQINELKITLMEYGQKITEAAESLRDAVWEYTEGKTAETLTLSGNIAGSAASALEKGQANRELVNQSVQLALESSAKISDINEQLTQAIGAASKGLSAVPTAVERVSHAVAGLGKVTDALDQSTRVADRSRDRSHSMSLLVIAVGVFAAVLGVAIAFWINRRLIRPLGLFTQGLHQVAQRDLTVQVSSKGTSGELKALIEGNNQLIRDLRQSINSMRQLAGEVLGNAQRLGGITENVSGALNEQSERTATMAVSMEELQSSVGSVSDNAKQASLAARGGDEEAKKGRDLIDRTITAISNLAQQIGDVVGSMGALNKDSENITSILDVIRDVAEQTNLLALNASIEAARAGEHGRGFAVVADEVRNLAHRTNEASVNIQDLIQGLQKRSSEVTQVVDNGARLLELTINESRLAGGAFEQVAESISQINEMNLTIASALEQQSHTTGDVTEHIAGINELSERNAEGARTSAQASEELAQAAEELEKMVGQYRV